MFLILAAAVLSFLVAGIRVNRRNTGFIITSAITVCCDVICFFLLGAAGIASARNALVTFYIFHAWIGLGLIWMTSSLDRHKSFYLYIVPGALLSFLQTVLMVMQVFGARVMFFQKHILLGRNWWIAYDITDSASLIGFRTYRILTYIGFLIILIKIVTGVFRSRSIFRGRYLLWLSLMLVFFVLEILSALCQLPVWVVCLFMDLVVFVGYYMVHLYPHNKLKDWSMNLFANDMSDGMILYDEYKDLVHMNDIIRDTLPTELLESFSRIDRIDEWMSDTTEIESIEVVRQVNDDKEFFFKVKRTELTENGSSLGVMYILHDTTASIRQIRIMEEANKELELASKMKSDFLANMSHEIRTPMNAVIGMAEIALREDLPDNVTEYLTQIQSSGRNLLNIINDILDFSKIEAGKMEIFAERYEPFSELNDIANVLATRIGDEDLELFVITGTNIPHALNGDAMRIRQILINLANNAIKFTRQGFVMIEVTCEDIDEDHTMLTYHVRDTGSGIRAEDLNKLFVSFQQVDSRRNRSVEGTGLGLAISQKLVEAMGGRIGVESEYGKGSDFWFSIPQEILDHSFDIVVENAGNKKATIINKDPGMVAMFVEETKRLGLEVEVITSPDEYVTSVKRDYVFFEENMYNDKVKKLLDDHPECTGVILVSFGSGFVPEQHNLRVMRRPETTLGMVGILNDADMDHLIDRTDDVFRMDFTAPDARILVVDDNLINLTIAEGLLKPLKCRIDSAGGGQAAIDMVTTTDYDIVLMDHMMPEIDGIDATRIIREMLGNTDLVIIALSANAMEGSKDMFLKAGMNDFVAKPIEVRELVSCIRKWLDPSKIIEGTDDEANGSVEETPASVEYEGLDCERAISSLGSAELYSRIVGEYYRSGHEKYDGIKLAFANEDWNDYTIRVHALKSSSRQIGAEELGSAAENLEKAGKAGDIEYIRANNDAALEAFRTLLDGLEKYFPTEERDESQLEPIDADALMSLIDQLDERCEELDMDGMEEVMDRMNGYAYPEEVREFIKPLFDAIANIDTDACGEITAQIRERMGLENA